MVLLGELLDPVSCTVNPFGRTLLERPVTGLTCDSRAVIPGSVFVAVKGQEADGHRYVSQAVARGCLAVVVDREVETAKDVAVVMVADSRRAFGHLAAAFYGYPAREMTMIGLTGTNGKTTTSWLVEGMLLAAGRRPGVIGTVNYRYLDRRGDMVVRDAPLTTPEPVRLQGLLREMADSGVTHVVMEVSSHALVLERLAGLYFDVGVFTNLSRDHLDFHGSMEAYFQAKRKLFHDFLAPAGVAVVTFVPGRQDRETAGDGWGRRLARELREKGMAPFSGTGGRQSLITCGFAPGCEVRAEEPVQDLDGLRCTIHLGGRAVPLESGLIGRYNVLNLLTAAGVGLALELEPEQICGGLAAVRGVAGRLERVRLAGQGQWPPGPAVFVDYAHTPDALENVLRTLRRLVSGRLVCVFGCGGDRDRGKRAMMGEVVGRLADVALLSSDNPRRENAAAIAADIEPGLRQGRMEKTDLEHLLSGKTRARGYVLVADRRQAIQAACALATGEDLVLVAGKGHETYQIIGDEKRFFDDRLEAKNALLRWNTDHLLRATGGTLSSGGRRVLLGAISTDSRTIEPGDVFLALTGEHFDGHDYVDIAVRKGAAAVIVERPLPPDRRQETAVILVADTLRALGDLARYRRRLLAPAVRVVGITGSSGKTTVKEMTAAIFAAEYEAVGCDSVLKTRGNLNNLIGLPLSLLRLKAEHRVAVLEMGMNRPGEIKRLAGIADPDIGCITNVQAAHLEGLGTIDGVAAAKGELFAAMRDDAVRVINYDDPLVRRLARQGRGGRIGFAVSRSGRRYHPEVRVTRVRSLGVAGMRFTLQINDRQQRLTVPAVGQHNVGNCAAAAAIALAAGVGPDAIVRGLGRYRSGDKRLRLRRLPRGLRVVDDSYNANPASMAAALNTVRTFGDRCRRAAALGDMLELGAGAAAAHRQIGRLVAELGYDFLAVTGQYAEETARAAEKSGLAPSGVMVCADTDAMAAWFAGLMAEERMRSGDWLLVKGSRSMRMELMLQSLELLLGGAPGSLTEKSNG
ncbi:UDP-N-acetylmuramoyl-L-alanyl-D-glutamate--LD-lysine ligase [bacterium BMS3Bbin14]|nr:UDP-N-acetylmuramoyl-L-alanyl-D-glutamate--LD-lysine ligase [bacterium BMS3Bbin14]